MADDDVRQHIAYKKGLSAEEYAEERERGYEIPPQFNGIVRQVYDLRHDIDFGYAVNRSELTYSELLGSRAYQRAINKIEAVRRELREEQDALDKLSNPS